jgi:hypothetical protein
MTSENTLRSKITSQERVWNTIVDKTSISTSISPESRTKTRFPKHSAHVTRKIKNAGLSELFFHLDRLHYVQDMAMFTEKIELVKTTPSIKLRLAFLLEELAATISLDTVNTKTKSVHIRKITTKN